MTDDVGPVKMDFEEVLVMPDIPVRPNHSIPTVTAIILILGGAMVAYAAYSSFVLDEQFTDAQEDQLATQFNESSNGQFDVSKEDMQSYDDNFSNSDYKEWSAVLFSSSALFLLTAGWLLFKKDQRGIRLGLLGAVILTATNLWGSSASKEAGLHLPEIASLTMTTMYYIYACCGLFCTVAAVMPMLFASGRAALSSDSVQLTTFNTATFGVEEE